MTTQEIVKFIITVIGLASIAGAGFCLGFIVGLHKAYQATQDDNS